MGWLRRLLGKEDVGSTSAHGSADPAAQPMVSSDEPNAVAAERALDRASAPLSQSSHPLNLFDPVYLTRRPSNWAAVTPLYAAFDLETTGLNAGSDRVCEVAVVRFRADGTVIDEYASLIDPQQQIRASEHHGISDADVTGAPTFSEAWPDIHRMLAGSVVVAHNLPFEDKFLAAELVRAGQLRPDLVGICSAVSSAVSSRARATLCSRCIGPPRRNGSRTLIPHSATVERSRNLCSGS
jgi:hypothetical protein